MIRADDLEHCRNVIRTGSLSFHAASKLLPASVRDPALALYAFCRLADDEVDEGQNKTRAVIELQERLALVYAGRPRNAPEDRAFASVVEDFEMPAALPEALLEGLAWDAMEHRYSSLGPARLLRPRGLGRGCNDVCLDARARCRRIGAGLRSRCGDAADKYCAGCGRGCTGRTNLPAT